MHSKLRARRKSVERLQTLKRLRALGAPLFIIKFEQHMMAINRQGILKSGKMSPALEAVLAKMNEE
ncbi:hypothetical protein PP939_gp160 [Rhizobium phage RL38J1]|uniref:Uncharacterized protein n=1 Tax=Rhizobium phage RL38J1 TaxID=2663232 RepID=A0A6B9J1I6_9CAUD|nr:hypothetical protein PP939_gp160 [Rhizobium phage RL38J1]QGZ14074.1 hypothetical protein RL38J1_160 [Rhizobium phage RL38J1]